MPHSTFPSGFIGLVIAIILCWMHRPFDCLDVPLQNWILNTGYAALCDREYRLKYFNDPEHRKAVLAGIFFVPPKMLPENWQRNPEEPGDDEDSEDFSSGDDDLEELSPTDVDIESSEELLSTNVDTGSSEFLSTAVDIKPSESLSTDVDIGSSESLSSDVDIGSSEDIGYPSGESVEFMDQEDRPSLFIDATRRLSKPIARNISGLRDLELRSKGKCLQKFVDHTLRKLQRMIDVFPGMKARRNEVTDFVEDGRIRYRKSQGRKPRNNFRVDEMFADRKFRSSKSRGREARNNFRVDEIFADRKFRSPKSRGREARSNFRVDDVFADGKFRSPKSRGREAQNSFKVGRIFGDAKFRSPKQWRQFKPKNAVDDRIHTNVRTLNLTHDHRRGKRNTSRGGVSRFLWTQESCKSHRRIVGGRNVDSPEELPYMAFVDTGCGGGIISNEWVLTAGHCVDRIPPIYVHVGSLKLMTGCQYNVEQVYIHPHFSRTYMNCDIALLRIKPGFVWSPAVQPIKISTTRAVRRSCGVVAGWGAKKFQGALRIMLTTTTLPIVSRRKCQNLGISKYEFCAGYDDASSDTCQGDSGGPFVVDGIFVGIVSFGYKCAQVNTPGVYVDVSYYRKWIRSVSGL